MKRRPGVEGGGTGYIGDTHTEAHAITTESHI